jgi:hypothetical protein
MRPSTDSLLTHSKTSRCRRISVALLLVLSLLPVLSAWFSTTASAEASLPACCRTHGKHHCSMGDQAVGTSGESSSPSMRQHQVSERCPFQGISSASQFSNTLGPVSDVAVEFDFKEEQALISECHATPHVRACHAQPKRGPPISSTLSHEV